jgi:flagellar hook assembly protein FlgD
VKEDAAAEAPQVFTLFQNAPNPFNPSTVIGFGLASDMPVRLAVYSAAGQKVRELVSGRMSAGRHSVAWNGRDDSGQPVSSGVYLYRLEAGGRNETRKMMLMR